MSPCLPAKAAAEPSKAGRALVGLALACHLAGAAQAQTADVSEAPPNMRAIIAANLQKPDPDPTVPAAFSGVVPGEMTIFPAKRQVSEVEISDAARRTLTMLHGWTWQTCLRATVGGRRITLAVFVARNHVIDARTALIADRCDEANYAPLSLVRPQPRPSTKAKKAKKPAQQAAGDKKKP
jgi:hypothetical protein